MIKKLSGFIGIYKRYLYIIPFLVVLDALAELSMPLLMARIIDIGILNKDIAYIARTGAAMVVLALTAMSFGILHMRTSTVAAMGIGANLRDAMFEKVQQFSFNNIDRFSTASLITRLTNDVNNLQMTLMMALRMLLRSPIMLAVAFFMVFNLNARLSMVIAVAIPLLAAGVVVIFKLAISRYALVQERIDQVNNILQENLTGIRVVKSFVTEKYEIGKFQRSNDALTDSTIRASMVVILVMPLMMLVLNGATLGIIWWGGRMVTVGTLMTGELVSFISYVMQILISVIMLSMVILMGARAKASADRVIEVLDTIVDIQDQARPALKGPAHSPPPQGVHSGSVAFRDVSFRYNHNSSGEDVLSGIDFSVRPGEVVGVVGGTGTGKSTLVHLIPRLYDVTSGAVLVDGVDVREYPLDDLRAGIGMVLQKNTLFSGTVLDNLRWGDRDASLEEVERAARTAEAHDFIIAFPDGYETLLSQGGVNLSGGQKQRLSIARALLKKPRILILDDSTSAVDSTTEARIRAALRKNLERTTLFIIAQRISSVSDADQILVLDDGRIAGMGTHALLLAGNAIYQEIHSSQQEGALAHE